MVVLKFFFNIIELNFIKHSYFYQPQRIRVFSYPPEKILDPSGEMAKQSTRFECSLYTANDSPSLVQTLME